MAPPSASARRPGPIERWLARYAALSLHRPWTLVLLGLLALLVAAPAAVRLYTDLRTDLRELLPRGAPAAVALETLEKRVGGFAHLTVVVGTDDLASGERFTDALAARLRPLVPSKIREIRYRLDEDHAYLDAHGALYADVQDLVNLNDGLRDARIQASPFDLGFDEESQPHHPGKDPRLERVAEKLRARAAREDHYRDGYLAAEDGKTLVMMLTPADAAVSLDANLALYRAVDAEVRALRPESFHPSLRVGYTGEVREVIEAQEHLVKDLELSSVLVLGAVALAIVLFYRRARALPLLALPLLTGTALTFAAGRFAIGYLNPNTAFLGSIICGNGVNAGIILLARYLEERRRGVGVSAALPDALTTTWRATLTASGAATASYACLGVTGFRGFNQFAFLGGVGMLLVWLSTYLLMPPMLVLFERARPLVDPTHPPRPAGLVARPFSRLLARWAGPVTALSLALTAASVVAAVRFARDPIEYDFTKLASRRGAVDGAGYWGRRVDEVMRSYLTPTVVLTGSAEDAASVAHALQAEQRARGPASPIASVTTLADLLPAEQPRKLALLRDIVGQIDDRLLRAVPDADRPLVERLRRTTELREVTAADLPRHLARLFHEKDGRTGRLVLVYPTSEATAAHGRVQADFVRTVREVVARTAPEAQVAGPIILTADIVSSITHDGSLAALLSFVAVALLTATVLGSGRDALWVTGSLCVGTLWMVGALGARDLKLNFVNFAVLPITFGIGVDYAVNFYQRYREIGRGGAAEAVATSGGAVALCSLTTILGYSSLLIADNRAIHSFGLTAVLGELTCLSAALISLPALLMLRDRPRRARHGVPATQA